MSAALYTARLYWVGMRGYAKRGATERRLSTPPVLPGLPALQLEAIDYTPEVHVAMLMPKFSGWRDMTAEEIKAADAALRALVPDDVEAP